MSQDMQALRVAALQAWEEGCEVYGLDFDAIVSIQTPQAIEMFCDSYHFDKSSALKSLREEHEMGCGRPHLSTGEPNPNDLDRMLGALRKGTKQE